MTVTDNTASIKADGENWVNQVVLNKNIQADLSATITAVNAAASTALWGSITGTLADQTDLNTALGLKAPLASPTFTGTVTIPTPFTLGAVSVTSTGTQLNYLSAATGTTGTTSSNLVFSTSPVLTSPTITTSLEPTTDNGAALGNATTKRFSDLFLASGGVINWDNGNAAITHSAGTLAFNSDLTITNTKKIQSSISARCYIDLDNTGNSLYVSAGTIDYYANGSCIFRIDNDNNSTIQKFIVRTNGTADNIFSIDELGNTVAIGSFTATDGIFTSIATTAIANTFTASSLTTGAAMRIISNSADTSSRNLLQIINDNTLATGAGLLNFKQDALTSTNFRLIFRIENTFALWYSNGTTPSGNLSGTAGDICVNADG